MREREREGGDYESNERRRVGEKERSDAVANTLENRFRIILVVTSWSPND